MKHFTPPEPIGGWLIVFSISLIIAPFRYIFSLFDYLPLFSPRIWNTIASPDSPKYYPGFAPFVIFEVLAIFLITILIIILLFLFFKRHPLFPKLIISFYLFNLVISIVDLSFAYFLFSKEINLSSQFYNFGTMLTSSAIWIPYFAASRRVKATFVQRVTNSHLNRPASISSPSSSELRFILTAEQGAAANP